MLQIAVLLCEGRYQLFYAKNLTAYSQLVFDWSTISYNN